MTLSRLHEILSALQSGVRLKTLISAEEAIEIGKVAKEMVFQWRRTFSVIEILSTLIAIKERIV